jgi:hypothetical protein
MRDRFVTLKEFCEAAKISYRTGLRLKANGSLKTVRFGKSIRVPLSEFERRSADLAPCHVDVGLIAAACAAIQEMRHE